MSYSFASAAGTSSAPTAAFFDYGSFGLEHHGHEAAFHGRRLLHDIVALELDQDPLEDLLADLGMGELPAAEADRHLDLEAILEKLPNVLAT